MRVITAINRFITTSVAGLYQELLISRRSFQGIANRLLKNAENAHAFRQYDRIYEFGEILSNFPLEQYQFIGQYYLALSMCRNGQADILKVRPLIENLAVVAPMPYRARAMQLLAATYGSERKPEQELYYYLESLKTKANTFTALRSIAVLKAKEGHHKQALKDLQGIYSFARYVRPHLYFDYLNSLAVELGEAGRKYEARNIIQSVVASPFAFAYPEWCETAEELKGPNRSFVVIDPSPARMGKLLSMPVVEHSEPAILDRPASVLSLQEWKDKLVKGKNGKNEKLPEDMSGKDMVVKIMNLTTQEGVSEKNLRKILDYVRKVLSEPEKD